MEKFLRDLFTGKDNKTWDLGRVMWAWGTVVYFAMTLYSLYKAIPVDPLNWATGFGAILAAGGAAIMLKRQDEPHPDTTTTTTVTAPPDPSITTTASEGEVV